MLASLVSKAPVVGLTLEHSDILLHPKPVQGEPTADPIVRGTVVLELSTARAVKKVKVVLEGLCDVFGGAGFGYESTITLHKQLEIDLRGEVLPKGSHALNFGFIVPSSTATYQRCEFGRVRHYVKATAEFAGAFQPSVSSPPVAFFLCANPYQPGEEMLTQLTIQHNSDDLGPIEMMISSPHLTVASLVNVHLGLLAPPQNATIISIQGVISQSFTISYSNKPDVATPPPQRHVMAKVSPNSRQPSPSGSPAEPASPSHEHHGHHGHHLHRQPSPVRLGRSPSPRRPTDESNQSNGRASSASPSPARDGGLTGRALRMWTSTGGYPFPADKSGTDAVMDAGEHMLVEGEEFSYTRMMRVPDDNFVRPSTHPGSDARISVAHTLGVEIKFRTAADPTEKLMTLAQVATIASCCCLSESVILPTYDHVDAEAGPSPTLYTGKPVFKCTCFNTVDDLYDRDGEQLQQAGRIEVDPNAEALVLGADRANKTPSVSEVERWRTGQAVEQGARGRVVPAEDD